LIYRFAACINSVCTYELHSLAFEGRKIEMLKFEVTCTCN